MKRGNLIIIILAILLLGLMTWFLFGSGRTKWRVTFDPDDLGPYGTYVLHGLISATAGDSFHEVRSYLNESLSLPMYEDENYHPDNYIYVGERYYLNHLETGHLAEFVARGNRAFILSMTYPEGLFDAMQVVSDSLGTYASAALPWRVMRLFSDTVMKSLRHEALAGSTEFVYHNDYGPAEFPWQYLSGTPVVDNPEMQTLILGSLGDSGPDLLAIPCGRGFFYIHLNPIVHSNHYLRSEEGLRFTLGLLAHAGSGAFYWDSFSDVPKPGKGGASFGGAQDGPLYFLLRDEALRWALYAMLGFILLFIIFRGRREQEIIPVLPERTNTSMDFVRTIANLYYLQNDPRKLALLKHRHFLFHVRSRYHLSLNPNEGAFALEIARRSGTDAGKASRILELARIAAAVNELSEEHLTEYHRLLDEFYKTCK